MLNLSRRKITVFTSSNLRHSWRRLISYLHNSVNMPSQNKVTKRGNKPYLREVTDLEESDSFPHIPMSYRMDLDEKNRDHDKKDVKQSLEGDYGNIALLMFLYVLQGIPIGLGGSIPMLLTSRSVSYKDQALFSFVHWPFSIKLLWAPIVDSVYLKWFGRRKSWLVPTQYLIGLFMMILSLHIKEIMGEGSDAPVDVLYLTVIFFMLNFLAATQDIAVDGWALTMLSKKNVGWASTCNTVGQTAGYFLGNVLFLALESADFCNRYLRYEPQKEGIVTLSGFLYFWGIVFFTTTTIVWLLKREKEDSSVDLDQGIIGTYKQLFKIICLPAVISYAVILLTGKIGFAAADSVTSLKLIESGMPKERLALFAVPLIPVQIIFPLLISKYTTGPRPLNVYLKAIPSRLMLGLVYTFIVYLAFNVQEKKGEFPIYFYLILFASYVLHQVTVYGVFVAQMAFHAKISDPAIGGTYMTLLNTVSNLGGNWPGTVALWLVDGLTYKTCVGGEGYCETKSDVKICEKSGGVCETTTDGYYIESFICVIIGVMWYQWRKRKIQELDSLDSSAWKCS